MAAGDIIDYSGCDWLAGAQLVGCFRAMVGEGGKGAAVWGQGLVRDDTAVLMLLAPCASPCSRSACPGPQGRLVNISTAGSILIHQSTNLEAAGSDGV